MRLNRRNKLLLVGFFLTLCICYSFAISNTIGYYNEYSAKEKQLANTNETPKLIAQLVQKEKQLDSFLSQYNINPSESFQNDLLKQLNTYSTNYHLKIIDFKEPHSITEKGFVTTSYVFSLEGSFNGCLALLNKIENNPSLGNIKHLNFTKKRNYKTNVDQLSVEVIMQKNQGV
ncbi:general secretion pathway protein [Flavobacterium hydatis]|uniref:General secretion pathway protein n=1 Tax=Flavobacterium hydatis TaxID=991 RepID=A0A086A5P5_FLAHY|nr:general secretion pathway protein [Flavobacterium hydatis]KFF12009.1 general secretion pathway protein [Flavobacterium hydatis]OXA94239.1 general secretion pathway protein [Flavobacterium hydatis]